MIDRFGNWFSFEERFDERSIERHGYPRKGAHIERTVTIEGKKAVVKTKESAPQW
jgi:hypothetical protein